MNHYKLKYREGDRDNAVQVKKTTTNNQIEKIKASSTYICSATDSFWIRNFVDLSPQNALGTSFQDPR